MCGTCAKRRAQRLAEQQAREALNNPEALAALAADVQDEPTTETQNA